jgi:hypothetical protein
MVMMNKAPRLNYMTQEEIDTAYDNNLLSDNQLTYLNNRSEMKEASKEYYHNNKNSESLVEARRRAELTRRKTDNYKQYMSDYRQTQREAFESLTEDQQNTIREMRNENRKESRRIKAEKKKKLKIEQQKKRLRELEEERLNRSLI